MMKNPLGFPELLEPSKGTSNHLLIYNGLVFMFLYVVTMNRFSIVL